MWKSFPCQISNDPDMSIRGDRKGTPMTCVTFTPVRTSLSTKFSLPIIYATFYTAMQHKLTIIEEKKHKPVFLTFKIQENFYIMRDIITFYMM